MSCTHTVVKVEDCEHEFKYCEHCDTVYCKRCRKEWMSCFPYVTYTYGGTLTTDTGGCSCLQ